MGVFSAPGQKKALYRRITAARNDYVVWMQLNNGQDPLNVYTMSIPKPVKAEVGTVGLAASQLGAISLGNTSIPDNLLTTTFDNTSSTTSSMWPPLRWTYNGFEPMSNEVHPLANELHWAPTTRKESLKGTAVSPKLAICWR